MQKNKKNIISILLLIFFLVINTLNIQAWSDFKQKKSNDFFSQSKTSGVILTKKEKDLGGEPTEITLPDAEFILFKKEGENNIQIGGTYKTNEEGLIIVEDLEPGHYYFEEIMPPETHDFDKDEDGNEIKIYDFEVKGDGEDIHVTAYNQLIDRELVIEKKLKNNDGSSLTDSQKELDFKFKVVFSDGGTYSYFIKGHEDEEISFTSGETISLKHGEQAVFKQLPLGLGYKVTEETHENFTTTSKNDVGTIGNQSIHVLFVNEMKRNNNLSFEKVVKNIDGSELTEDQLEELKTQEFTFHILFYEKEETISDQEFLYTINSGPEQIIKSGDTISIKNGDRVDFIDLPIGIKFKIFEDLDDNFIASFDQIQGTITTENNHITFENYFKESVEKAKGDLEISKKIISDEEIDKEVEFEFELILSRLNEKGEYIIDDTNYLISINNGDKKPMRNSDEDKNIFKLSHKDKIEIFDIPAGTKFIVVEKEHKDYQANVDQINGVIIADNKVVYQFLNLKTKKEEMGKITVKKIVSGIETEMEFEFELTINEQSHSFTLKDGQSKTFTEDIYLGDSYQLIEKDYTDQGFVTTISNGKGVVGSVNEINILVENTYKQEIETTIKGEKTWDLQGEDLDLPEYIIIHLYQGDRKIESQKVMAQDGKWLYEFKVPKFDREGNEIDYRIEEEPISGFVSTINDFDIKNTFIKPLKMDLPIRKTLENKDDLSQDVDFKFKLIPINHSLNINENIISIVNEGTNSFRDLVFDEEGIYSYRVTEINENHEHIFYDKTSYQVDIKIQLVENQLKVIALDYYNLSEDKKVDNITFVNRVEKITKPPVKPEVKPKPPTEKVPDTSEDRLFVNYLLIIIFALMSIILLLVKELYVYKNEF